MANAMKKQKSARKRRVKTVILCVLLACTVGLLGSSVWLLRQYDICELDISLITNSKQTLYLYDREDMPVAGLYSGENRTIIPLSSVPDHVINAFLAVEDVRFYSHCGVDFRRIAGALVADIKAGSYVQGASTITQQLIKLSHLSSEKTIARKVQEAILAIQLEQQCSKDEILEMYLNYVYFGGGAYGIEAASMRYFAKPASELTLADGALLAGIVKSPSNYAPHLDYAASLERRDLILDLMAEHGFITQAQADEAKTALPEIHSATYLDYPHGYYVEAAMEEARELLGVTQEELLSGGYRIYTYLDTKAQTLCETAFSNGENFPENAADGAQVQASIVVCDPDSFAVTAMMGGREHSVKLGLNRASDIRRQPGSTIKPLLVYAPAIDIYGYSTVSVLLDQKTDFAGYIPSNFDDSYSGPVTLREAVARSLNVPAVRLLSNIGVTAGKTFAQRLGIPFAESDNSLTLALGGFTYGVSPLELCGAYSAFAAGGAYAAPSCIRYITDSEGNLLYFREDTSQRVMDESTAFLMNSLLASCVSEGTGKRVDIGIPLCAKTGTTGLESSSGNKDAWMVAYNRDYVACVWMGYDNSDAEHCLAPDVTGGTYPAQILKSLFSGLYPDPAAAPDFVMPDSVSRVLLDAETLETEHVAVLANGHTPADMAVEEYFVTGSEPTASTKYWDIPKTPDDFSVSSGEDGMPVLSFTARQAHVNYEVHRMDQSGNDVRIAVISDKTGVQTIRDSTASYGSTYGYYVLPTHGESAELTGRRTSTLTISVSNPYSSFYLFG